MINVEVLNKLSKAITDLGSVAIMEDAQIPGCPHMNDRYIFHLRQLDQSSWEAHRMTLLALLAAQNPPMQVHVCTMHTYDVSSKTYRDFYNIELAANSTDADRFVALLADVKKKPMALRAAQIKVNVESDADMKLRTDKVTSAPLSTGMVAGR